jgi:2-phosphosulfolactate phosphatase
MVVHVDLEFVARDKSKAVKRGNLIIVIDVLRASTSIIVALAKGAKSVIPTTTLREAYQLHKKYPDYVLVGERGGCKPRGFDIGNSPVALAADHIRGKNLIITTTNGTKALAKSKGSRWVLIGAFLNAEAIAKKATEISKKSGGGISFVLAGEKNHFSLEDFICAGAIAEGFPENMIELSDKATAALLAFREAKSNLFENVKKSEHAKNLTKLGLGKDIEFSCQLSIYETIPFYRDGKIQNLSQMTDAR